MANTPKAWMAWSSGKDSAWGLHVARSEGLVEVVGLLTTLSESYQRVAMHGVRDALLQAQSNALGLPLHRVPIPSPCSNDQYEAAMGRAMDVALHSGVTHMVFGDLFLQDVRAYREVQLARAGLAGYFPLWGRDTRDLARAMIRGGLRAYLVCIDPRHVPRVLAGHAFDDALLSVLPPDVDPCGERGEFHTFACGGPMFSAPIDVIVGESVERDGFVFTDLTAGEVTRVVASI